LCILAVEHFNYVYKNEQNVCLQVGLNSFVVITPWRRHLGAEICGILCM